MRHTVYTPSGPIAIREKSSVPGALRSSRASRGPRGQRSRSQHRVPRAGTEPRAAAGRRGPRPASFELRTDAPPAAHPVRAAVAPCAPAAAPQQPQPAAPLWFCSRSSTPVRRLQTFPL